MARWIPKKTWAQVGVRKFLTIAKRVISKERRKKWARVGVRKFRVIFTYYRLSRKLLVTTRDFICSSKNQLMIKHVSSCVSRRSNSRRDRRVKQQYYKYSSEEDHEDRWSKQLPEDIMQLILQKLCIPDYLRCRAVCRSWLGATVNMEIASKRCRLVPQLPWLLLRPHHRFSVKDDCFLSPSDQKIYKSNLTYHMNRLDCVGSVEGWLIMVDTAERRPEGFMKPWSFYLHDPNTYPSINFFLNPISGARVMLPSQSTIPCHGSNHDSFLWKVVASTVPTSPHCLVASLCSGGLLAFCRPTDKSWTLIEEGEEVRDLESDFHDIELIDGKLYAISREAPEVLIVYDIQLDFNGGPHTYRAERLEMLHPRPVPCFNETTTRDGVIYVDKSELMIYLFKDSTSKELFMIFCSKSFGLSVDHQDPAIPWPTIIGCNIFAIPPQTQGFRVFKLEHSNGSRWVEVVDLGNRILFLSHHNKLFVRPGPHEKTPDRNCIYFAFHTPCITSPSNGYDFGVFSFATGRIDRHTFLKDHTPARLHSRLLWFTPTLW